MELQMLVIQSALFLTTLLAVNALRSDIIEEFFVKKNKLQVTTRSCSMSDIHKLLKYLMAGQRLLVEDVTQRDVTLVRLHSHIGIYLDLTCDENYAFLDKMSSDLLFNSSYTWLIWIGKYEDIRILSNTTIGVDSDVVVALELELYCVHRSSPNSPLIIEYAGNWTEIEGLSMVSIHRQLNLNGAIMKGGISVSPEFSNQDLSTDLQKRTHKLGVDHHARFAASLHFHLSDLFNYTLVLVKSNNCSDLCSHESLPRMMELLERGEINLTVGPLHFSLYGSERADSFVCFMKIDFPFVFRQPRRISSFQGLFLQFQFRVWLVLGTLFFISTVTLFIIFWASSKIEGYRDCESSLSFTSTFVVGALTLQGLPMAPRNLSGRIAALFLLLLGFMSSTYYNAATMNALLSSTPTSIRTLDQLTQSLPMLFINSSYFRDSEIRNVLLFPKIQNEFDDNKLVTLREGLQCIKDGKALCGESFSVFDGINNHLGDRHKCDLAATLPGPVSHTANYIQKKSQFLEMLRRGGLRLKEHGLVHRQYNYWAPPKPQCTINQPWVPVSTENVSVAFFVIGTGLIFSLTAVIMENVVYFILSKKKKIQ